MIESEPKRSEMAKKDVENWWLYEEQQEKGGRGLNKIDPTLILPRTESHILYEWALCMSS